MKIFHTTLEHISRNMFETATDIAISSIGDSTGQETATSTINSICSCLGDLTRPQRARRVQKLFEDGNTMLLVPDLMEELEELNTDETPFAIQIKFNDLHLVIIDGTFIQW